MVVYVEIDLNRMRNVNIILIVSIIIVRMEYVTVQLCTI